MELGPSHSPISSMVPVLKMSLLAGFFFFFIENRREIDFAVDNNVQVYGHILLED